VVNVTSFIVSIAPVNLSNRTSFVDLAATLHRASTNALYRPCLKKMHPGGVMRSIPLLQACLVYPTAFSG
jgi:hypothetical protein